MILIKRKAALGPTVLTPGDNATWNNVVGTTVGIGTLQRTGGGFWSASATFDSIPANTSGFVQFSSGNTGMRFMAGLNTDPSADSSHASLDFAFDCNRANLGARESGSGPALNGSQVSITTLQVLKIERTINGSNSDIDYYQDGVLVRSTTMTSTSALSFDCSFAHMNGVINNISIEHD